MVLYIAIICFNPRARDGRELAGTIKSVTGDVSIHAPVMDANRVTSQTIRRLSFNPRARDGRERKTC